MIINLKSKLGGFVSIDTAALLAVLDRLDSVRQLAGTLVGQMEDSPDQVASQFDVKELDDIYASEYTNEAVNEVRSLISDLNNTFGGYAEEIIQNEPQNFDNIEIHGVRQDENMCENDNVAPTYFSVNLHLVEGHIECVGDFATHPEAVQYANDLSVKYGWGISDFSPAPLVKSFVVKIEVDPVDKYWYGLSVTDSVGNVVPSAEMFELQRVTCYLATQQAGFEASKLIEPGRLYLRRARGGVCYFVVDKVDAAGKVFVHESDKNGVKKHPSRASEIFMDAQHLTLVKKQPLGEVHEPAHC